MSPAKGYLTTFTGWIRKDFIVIFLMEYDRSRGELISIEAFGDSDRDSAENERLWRELKLHKSGAQREVVLLQAADENALRKTHRRYFVDIATLAESNLG